MGFGILVNMKARWEKLPGTIYSIIKKVPYVANSTQNNIPVSDEMRTYVIPISLDQAVKNEYNAKWVSNTGEITYACVKSGGDKW